MQCRTSEEHQLTVKAPQEDKVTGAFLSFWGSDEPVLLDGSWAIIIRVINPLIWVVIIVALHINYP